MVPGLWPLVGTFYSPYHVSTMLRYVGDWLWSWFAVILTWWSGGLRGQFWPLLLGQIEYFQNSSQTIHNYAIPIQFRPMVTAPALYHYFIGFMVPGLWPLVETFLSLYNDSNMPRGSREVPHKWFELILTWLSGGLWGQLWPLASFVGSDWLFPKYLPNHP